MMKPFLHRFILGVMLVWCFTAQGIEMNKAVVDPPSQAEAVIWGRGLTEMTSAYAPDDAVSSGLIAGEAGDFRAEISLNIGGTYSATTGVVFGFSNEKELWLAGFNPREARFEIICQTEEDTEILASSASEVKTGAMLIFEVIVAGKRVTIVKNRKEQLSFENSAPISGQVGIGSVCITDFEVIFESVRFLKPDNSPLFFLDPLKTAWKPFRAATLTEGKGEWRSVRVLVTDPQSPQKGFCTALLLDAIPTGERYRYETLILTSTKFSGLGMTGIVFGFRDSTHYNLLGYKPEHGRIEIWHRSKSGLEPVSSAVFDTEETWLTVSVEGSSDRVRVFADGHLLMDLRDERFKGEYSGIMSYGNSWKCAVWRDDALSTGGDPLPPKAPDDLLAYEFGTRALLLEPADLEKWEALIDHSILNQEPGASFSLAEAGGPVSIVFAFAYQRLTRIEQLEIYLDGPEEVGTIRFLSSIETPLTGFSELAVMNPGKGDKEILNIDPVKAKYLRIEIPQAGQKEGQIAEIFVRGSLLEKAVQGQTAETSLALNKVSPDREEREINDTPEKAMRLPPDIWIGGKTGFGDVDYYSLTLPAQGGSVKLFGRNTGAIPASYVLLGADGQEARPVSMEQTKKEWTASYNLGGGVWMFRVTGDPISLTVLFDDSGSMGDARDALPKLLMKIADRVGPGLRIKLMKYASTPVEIFDFVENPEILREAAEREVSAEGGTETLIGLTGGLESLKNVTGNRALLVALDGIDGFSDENGYMDIIKAAVTSRISMYIISITEEEDWDNEKRVLDLSDRNLLSELAWITNGRLFINPDLNTFEKCITEVLSALSGAVPYQVIAEYNEAELPPEPEGPGSLEVRLSPGIDKEQVRTIEIILDASNSMWGQINGKAKIEIARQVLSSLIETIPDGFYIGLRIYGHRWPINDARACSDSELVIPIGAPDRAALLNTVKGISPRGRTPLFYSLLQTPQDFKGIPSGTVILISDGIESCDGRIDDVVKTLHASGIDLNVHIIGFDVKERNAREQLETAANALGGRYFDAGDSKALAAALERTLKIEYQVIAADSSVAARGVAGGDPVTLEAGDYRIRVLLEPLFAESAIKIEPGKSIVVKVLRDNKEWNIQAE
ncbi:MAG: hypothetical protein GX654_11440 [Desulfatiglans sp.]|nr:hypothetical protein [Desulfatiglans sp.]